MSVAALASTEKAVSRAYSGLLVQSLLSCASCGVLEQHLLAHPYLCLVSCVCVCLLHPCSYDAVSVCVLLAYCLCVCVLHPYLLLRRRVCLCLASLRPCLWCTCERACATIHFSPCQAPEVGYPQRPRLKKTTTSRTNLSGSTRQQAQCECHDMADSRQRHRTCDQAVDLGDGHPARQTPIDLRYEVLSRKT